MDEVKDVKAGNETTPTANECIACYKTFPTATQLRLHLVGARHKSTIKTEYQCSDCGKFFQVR